MSAEATTWKGTISNILTVDLEDWYHILDIKHEIPPNQWHEQPARIERNTELLLESFDRCGVKATFFALGWVGEHFRSLIRRIDEAGHRIASHGHLHRLLFRMDRQQFRDDLRRSLDVLGGIVGSPVRGYRAAGFSLTRECLWAAEILAEEGIQYDSSIFPTKRGHGGLPGACQVPFVIQTAAGQLLELPISTATLLGQRIAYCGGGYLRLFPLWFIRPLIRQANKHGVPVVLYIHPRDIDPDQPRLPMPAYRRFKSYVGLRNARRKLEAILHTFPFGPAEQFLETNNRKKFPQFRITETAGQWALLPVDKA